VRDAEKICVFLLLNQSTMATSFPLVCPHRLALTVHEVATPASRTDATMPAEKADTYPLAYPPLVDAAPQCIDPADRLMTGDARVRESRKIAFDGRRIGVANTAGFDADSNVSGRRLCYR
jgi:hypothetical protein